MLKNSYLHLEKSTMSKSAVLNFRRLGESRLVSEKRLGEQLNGMLYMLVVIQNIVA